MHKLVTEELNVPFENSDGKPFPPLRLFNVLVYPNRSSLQTVIILKLHSATLDRPSCRIVAQEYLAKLNLAVEGRLYHASNNKCDDVLLAPIEEVIPKGKASKWLLRKGVDAVGYTVNSKKSLLPFQPSLSGSGKTLLQSNIVCASLGKQGSWTVGPCWSQSLGIPC